MEKYIMMRDKIDEILDNFDFERCLIAMNALGWKYHDVVALDSLDLKKKARGLLLSCIKCLDTSNFYASSGGFDAERVGDDLSLRFVVERGESW